MRTLLLAATALAVLTGAAYAQNSNSGSNSAATVNTTSGSSASSASNPRVNVKVGNLTSSSTSGAQATSGSRSTSRSSAVGNRTTVNVGSTSGGSSATTAGDPTEQYIGYGGGYTVRNTPEVLPPNVVGGNACAVGASGGLAVAGFGIAGGATWADRACERRQQAALLFNFGEQKVALELMCQDDSVRSAMKVAGKPCTADSPVAQAAPAPAVAQTAMAPKATQVAAVAPAHATPKPDWCTRAAPSTEASKAYVMQACGS